MPKTIYLCKDCANPISYYSALYGKGRCCSCANKGKNNPSYGKNGTLNSNYKHGKLCKTKKYFCIDCKKEISISNGAYGKNRCQKCYGKWRESNYIGKDNCNYIDGRTNKKYYCKDCGIQICTTNGVRGKGRCKSCSRKGKLSWSKGFGFGENHPLYIDGRSSLEYPNYFSIKLKKKIRERDNYTCQKCGLVQKQSLKKYRQILHVHHIDYNRWNCKKSNLITLCKGCNIKANFNKDYYYAYYTYLMKIKGGF
jgi:hypothetical protein